MLLRFFTTNTARHGIDHLRQILTRQENALARIKKNPDMLQKCRLVRDIIDTEVTQAQWRRDQPSGIKQLIENIPTNLSHEQRIQHLHDKLITYPARPVMTAHPTMVYTEDALQRIHNITQAVLAFDDKRTSLLDIENDVHYLIHHPMIPEQNLTPSEEAKRSLFIYQNMLKNYPEFLSKIASEFVKVHGGIYEEMKKQLRPAVMASFSEIGSWVKGDTDGNPNVTAKTKAQTIPDQQKAIIHIYLGHLDDILKLTEISQNLPRYQPLQDTVDYFHRCLKAIDAGIWFDMTGSEIKTKQLLLTLSIIIEDEKTPETVKEKIKNLSELLQLAGLAGGLKEFVRQTTVVNDLVFDELVTILASYHINIQRMLGETNTANYQALPDDKKLEIHKLLCRNPDYFKTLRTNAHLFSETTKIELERLAFILEHKDIFPYYIYSDTKTPVNFEEVRILTWFSAFMNGKLRIENINHHPFFNIPLCETPADIKNIGTIIRAMLDNRYMRTKIIKQGYISYVSGPSDLGKTGGITTHIDLVMAQMNTEDILEEYKRKYPALNKVVVRVLHGFGGDMKRRIGAERQLHSTHQGAAAYYRLGAPGAYDHFLHRVVGQPSEADLKVLELRDLQKNNLARYTSLINFKESCITAFESYVNNAKTSELLQLLTYPELERKMNTSSRAASKDAKKSDPSKARAIGVLNHYTLAGMHADIFMSLAGIGDLSDKDRMALPLLFDELTVIKDIVYKTIYSIACSDPQRAWKKLGDSSNTSKQTLLEWQDQALQVLKYITYFLPSEQATIAQTYLNTKIPAFKNGSIRLSQLTIELMSTMGNGFTQLAQEATSNLRYHQQLATCLEAYQKNPASPLCEENAILACRGVRHLVEGPAYIAELKSPLGLIHAATPTPEMRMLGSISSTV